MSVLGAWGLSQARDLKGIQVVEGEKIGRKPLRRRILGRTGEELSLVGLGGVVYMNEEQERVNRIVQEAIDNGVNYFDVAPTYGDAEELLGPALKPFRDRVFLACKTEKRDRDGAEEELNQSLRRLQTDHLDLYQLHALKEIREVDRALGWRGGHGCDFDGQRRGEDPLYRVFSPFRRSGFEGHGQIRLRHHPVPGQLCLFLQGGFRA
jgi:hypothetical protein